MNIQIIHKETKTIKTVRELDDLLFEQGWRFYNHISNRSTNPFVLDETMQEISKNKENGYIQILSKNTF